MTQSTNPAPIILRDEAIAVLEAIERASRQNSRMPEEIMEASKLLEQRCLNINLARIADALDLLVIK
jgi:hypothetical protein